MGESVVLALAIDGQHTLVQLVARSGQGVVYGIAEQCVDVWRSDYVGSMANITRAVQELRGTKRIVAADASITSHLLPDGTIAHPGRLPNWFGQQIKPGLASVLDDKVPVVTLTHAQACALAERRHCSGEFVYVDWGEGIDVALNLDGDQLPRPTLLGHITIDPSGHTPCGCGGKGHWEARVGEAGIPNRYFTRQKWSLRTEQLGDKEWDIVLREMATGLRAVAAIMPDSPIVLGGSMVRRYGARMPQLKTQLRGTPSALPTPCLLESHYGKGGAGTGAAIAAWHAYDQLVA